MNTSAIGRSSARTIPVWSDVTSATSDWWTADPPSGGPCDVVIAGAGIAGLSTALVLLRQGREVLLVDRTGIGAGETLRTTAHLASALDDRWPRLERYHGREGARLAAASHAAAIDWIEALVGEAGQDCGFRRVPGYLFPCDGDTSTLRREAEAAARAGLDVSLDEGGVPGLPALGPVLRFANQARVDMGLYLMHLANEVRKAGARFLRAEASGVEGGDTPRLRLLDGTAIRARQVVSAANVPFHGGAKTFVKQAPYRTYVVAGWAPGGSIPDALYWDDGDPYHYVRLREPTADDGHAREGEVQVIVGGEDHKVGQDDDPEAYVRLQDWTRRHFPSVERFTEAWSGQVQEPSDGLGLIGADPDNANVFIVTGDSGNGITHGTLAGLLLGDLMQGRPNPLAELYDPGRRRWASAGSWLGENANAAMQYRDWIAPADMADPTGLAPGNGAVLRHGVHRIAAYRDGDGVLHTNDATCTHMGCVVRWSSEEKSWDCPCHGSRFEAVSGAVLNGPAAEPLGRADAPDDWV